MASNMEEVFFRLHFRFSSTITRFCGFKTRRYMEYLSLAYAFTLVGILCLLHHAFVSPTRHCLQEFFHDQGIDATQIDVLHIKILPVADDTASFPGCLRRDTNEDPYHGHLGDIRHVGQDSYPLKGRRDERSYLFSFEKGKFQQRVLVARVGDGKVDNIVPFPK